MENGWCFGAENLGFRARAWRWVERSRSVEDLGFYRAVCSLNTMEVHGICAQVEL